MMSSTAYSFEQFSDFCLAAATQGNTDFRILLKEYMTAHPTHGAALHAHFVANPVLYKQLVESMQQSSATLAAAPDDGIDWRDRAHRDDDQGYHR